MAYRKRRFYRSSRRATPRKYGAPPTPASLHKEFNVRPTRGPRSRKKEIEYHSKFDRFVMVSVKKDKAFKRAKSYFPKIKKMILAEKVYKSLGHVPIREDFIVFRVAYRRTGDSINYEKPEACVQAKRVSSGAQVWVHLDLR